jgi:drug/metabolite transporter (DMT)-like permease
MRRFPVYLFIAFSILCLSTSAIIIRYCSAPAMIIALYRVLFTIILAAGLGAPLRGRNYRDLGRRDILLMAAAGFFLALHFAFWFSSLDYTSVSSSVLFTNLQVIFVLFFSLLFLHEKVNAWIIGGIIVAVLGSALIAHGDLAFGKFGGDMLALASGLFVAVYFIIGRQVRKRVQIWTYTTIVSSFTALVLLVTAWLRGLDFAGFPRYEWGLFFLLALGPGIAGHGILNWALKYVQAPVVAVSILGESVGASILAWILFHEHLLWYQLLGGMCILTGIYLAASHEGNGGEWIDADNN